ncbi:sn1-specific diacylglycerol lipase alpha [Aspergillus udagawae]|uniref:sn-1-specific diacylglycerol lipase n=1 Tax=Aspergillus udagawae TaxID=91492 RepID=A0ABQ1APJ9_9EURO|nr:sn1-specific diacylglycerol lipase alpha [Aspergillus udagawae]GFF85731.1 sn1-specific diacylglycerol lipase alpha [Aspergillus udagawae]GFG06338.1 sn1-specific diacylglycerol lipase alpha [Aspergillus udagawae]GFG26916.1 sn1-specific diacylglycerol lipase alpha [Aspergillus udagawae]
MSRLLGFGSFFGKRVEAEGDIEEALNCDGASHVPATSGATLLPRPVASALSILTQSTSLSLKLGSFFGGIAIEGARVTTLTGLELSRAVIEGILTRAGRDVALRSSGERGKVEAESLLERSLAALHNTVTSASFFAAATFHFSSTTLSSAAHVSQALLSTLDAILGSTESSRAIAAIITLIRREFRSPNAEIGTDNIGVGDLLVGTVGFAMLQRWGRKSTERHMRLNGGHETVWDVVILDNGARADVIGTHPIEPAGYSRNALGSATRRSSFISPSNEEERFDAVPRPSSVVEHVEVPQMSLPASDQQVSDEDIRLHIMRQLPRGCRASIRSDVVTTRTITVDIYDDENAEIAAPPGMMMIGESFHNDRSDENTGLLSTMHQLPKHTVVFRTAFNKIQNADVRPSHRPETSNARGLEIPTAAKSLPALPSTLLDIKTQTDNKNDDSQARISNSKGLSNEQPSTTGHIENLEYEKRHSHIAPESSSERSSSMGTARDAKSSGAKKYREVSSSGPVNEPSTGSKGAFGKGSLTRLAQKVKPASVERDEAGKRAAQRSSLDKAQRVSKNATQRNKMQKGLLADKRSTHHDMSTTPTVAGRAIKTTRPHTDRTLSPVANRGVPRSPLHDTWLRTSPSQTRRVQTPNKAQSDAQLDYFTVQELNQESFITQSDSYSFRSAGTRPNSPAATRTHVRSSSSLSLTRSETDMALSLGADGRPTSSGWQQRTTSFAPSIYSLATAGSETSLVLAHRARKSAYDDIDTIRSLTRDGIIPGIFPEQHFVQNIRRFCRFSSASYGSNALKVMGVTRPAQAIPDLETDSQEHSDFSVHTGLPASTILLSSFVDPAGGTNAAGETDSGFPLVHYVCLDHASKAVVLTLRGTWGFEDVLTDMTCDYDDLVWQGRSWKVHKGMHASARRLLMGGGGRVMITIRAALEEFPDYGVVLCGHSLGGGVAALLATMISVPNSEQFGTSFVTATPRSAARRILQGNNDDEAEESRLPFYLPTGRPIHVYAYGPPSAMSPLLRRATRGLITTIVNGQDVVPSLSLGILHDMHTVSVAFKSDTSGTKSHVRYRVWEGLRQSIVNKFYVHEAPMLLHAGEGVGEDAWAWKTLKALREEMCAPKLLPPGEVFVVETMRVLQRNAFTSDFGGDGYPMLGRPATRVQLKFIRDVESLFGELRFGSGMFSDHNPARYEASLAALAQGILDD